jgi:hypothetical protein
VQDRLRGSRFFLRLVRVRSQRETEGGPAFQAATEAEFVSVVEAILDRKIRAFASGVDPGANVVFESFYFEPRRVDGDGRAPAGS